MGAAGKAAAALYENPQSGDTSSHRGREPAASRDISEYAVTEEAPTNAYLDGVIRHLPSSRREQADILVALRRRFGLGKARLKSGLTALAGFAENLQKFLPCLFSHFSLGSAAPHDGAGDAA